jgi:hypothetical protein
MTTDEPAPDDEEPAPVEYSRKRAIAALGANIAVVLFCSPLIGMVGIVAAGIGLSRVASRPESARAFIRWAWIIAAIAVGLTIVLNVLYVITGSPESSTLTGIRPARYA